MRIAVLTSLLSASIATELTLHSFSTSRFPNAVCNDGSAAGFYLRESPSKSSVWIVFLEGGGWCWDEKSCSDRSPSLTSSKSWPASDNYEGIMDAQDPLLANANLVYMRYCTSDGWIGGNDAPFSSLPFRLHGRAYIDAAFSTLASDFGFGSVPDTQLLFSGCSAGARGALFNTYRVGVLARALAGAHLSKFGAFYDSAFWVDLIPLVTSETSFATQVQDAYALFNVSDGVLEPACLAAYADAPWKCMFGEYAIATVSDSFFVHAYQYDLFQLGVDEDLGGKAPTTAPQLAYAEKFRNATRAAAARDVISPARAGTSALLPACFKHCNTGSSTFYTSKTNGVSLEDMVVAWFMGSTSTPAYVVENCAGLNCGHDCPPL